MQVEIRSKRLLLRRSRPEDVDAMDALAASQPVGFMAVYRGGPGQYRARTFRLARP